MKTVLNVIASLGLWALCCGSTSAAEEGSKQKIAFQIDAPSLAEALVQFTAQSKVQFAFSGEKPALRNIPRVVGQYTPREALDRLLATSGLQYEFVNDRTVSIRGARSGNSTSNDDAPGLLRVADTRPSTAASTSADDKEKEDAQQVTVTDKRDVQPPFKGNRVDITRTEDDVLPFQVFDAKDIELSGAVDLNQFLRDNLPQNTAFTSEAQMLEGAFAGAAATSGNSGLADDIDLRGWGSQETMLLLNGRPMGNENYGISGNLAGTTSTKLASLRSIPLGSIERIEILSSASSAIYGPGATGGAINIITRRDYTGGQLVVSYTTPTGEHHPQRAVNMSFGRPIPGGFSLRVNGSFQDAEPSRIGDAADVSVERWRQTALARAPTSLINQVGTNPLRTSTQLYGAAPNIRASVAGTANTPGPSLFAAAPTQPQSNFTTVPAGYTGAGLTNAQRLALFTPAQYNIDLADGTGSAFAREGLSGSRSQSVNFGLGVDKRFGENWEWSADYQYSKDQQEGQPRTEVRFQTSNDGNYAFGFVGATVPTNPFGTAVAVSLIDPNLARPELQNKPSSTVQRFSSSFRGQLGRWTGIADVSYAIQKADQLSKSLMEPIGGWAAALNSQAYNPFVDTRVASPAAPQFYENLLIRHQQIINETRNSSARLTLSGPAFNLPAGAVQLTGGLQASRSDRTKSGISFNYYNSGTGQPGVPVNGVPTNDVSFPATVGYPGARLTTIDNYALYSEVVVPVLSASQGIPLVHRLEIHSAGRIERNKQSGVETQNLGGIVGAPAPPPVAAQKDATTASFGFRYQPVEDLSLRASMSLGEKPPTVEQLNPFDITNSFLNTLLGGPQPINYNDPKRGGQQEQLLATEYIRGGNPNLESESTESLNVGLNFSPGWAKGLRVAVDYLQSLRDNSIASLSITEALLLEDQEPGVITRGAPDGHPSGIGPVTLADLRYKNQQRTESRSVDINVEQTLDTGLGRLSLVLAGSRLLSFKVQTGNTGAMVEQVRNPAAGASRQVGWRGNTQVRWERAAWNFGWTMRYYDYLLVSGANNLAMHGGVVRVPADYEHDLNINYRTQDMAGAGNMWKWLSGSSLTLNIRNVLNREPRFWAASTSLGIAPGDNLNGRTLQLQMRKDF